MDTTQFLFFVWIMFLAIFILSLLFALFTPKVFTYTSQNSKSKQLIRKILITNPIREYRRQLKISILFSTLGLIVMWIGIIYLRLSLRLSHFFYLPLHRHHIFLSGLSLLTMNISTGQEQKKKNLGRYHINPL